MDALGFKDSDPKQIRSSNSAELKNSNNGKPNPKRRPPKDSYCELDIVERYGRERKNKRHSCDSKQRELLKKIREVTSTNKEIEKLSSKVEKQVSDSNINLKAKNTNNESSNDRTSVEFNGTIGDFYNTQRNPVTKTHKNRGLSKENVIDLTENLGTNNCDVKGKITSMEKIKNSKKTSYTLEPTYRKHKRHNKEYKTSDNNTNIEVNSQNTDKCSTSICQNCSGDIIESHLSQASNVKTHQSKKHRRKRKTKCDEDKTKINSLVSNKYFSKHQTDSELHEELTKQIITVYKNVNVLTQSDSSASKDAKIKIEGNTKVFSIFGIKRKRLQLHSKGNHDALKQIKPKNQTLHSPKEEVNNCMKLQIPENKEVSEAPAGNSLNIKPTALAYFHKFGGNKNGHIDEKPKHKSGHRKKEFIDPQCGIPEQKSPKASRRELSFSNLNLAPVRSLYANLDQTVCVKTQVSTAKVKETYEIEENKSHGILEIGNENKESDKNEAKSSIKFENENKSTYSIKMGNEDKHFGENKSSSSIKIVNEDKKSEENNSSLNILKQTKEYDGCKKSVSRSKMLDKQELQKLSQTALALRDIIVVTEFEKKNALNNTKQLFAKNTKPKYLKNTKQVSPNISFNNSGLEDLIAKQNLLDLQNKHEKAKQLFTRNTKFHTNKSIIPNERVVEVSSKVFMDQKVSFTVEAIEPARRIQVDSRTGRIIKNNNLKIQVFPGIEINSISDVTSLNHGFESKYRQQDADEISIDSLNKPIAECEKTIVTSELEKKDFFPKNTPIISPGGFRKSKFHFIHKDLFKRRHLKIISSQDVKNELLCVKKMPEDNHKFRLTDSATQTMNCSYETLLEKEEILPEKESSEREISLNSLENSKAVFDAVHLSKQNCLETKNNIESDMNFHKKYESRNQIGSPKSTCVAHATVVTDNVFAQNFFTNSTNNNTEGLFKLRSVSRSENNLLLNKHDINTFQSNSCRSRGNVHEEKDANSITLQNKKLKSISYNSVQKNSIEHSTCNVNLFSKNKSKCDIKKIRKSVDGKISKIPILCKSSSIPSKIIRENSQIITNTYATAQSQFINDLKNKICNEKMNVKYNEDELILLENCLNAIVTTYKKKYVLKEGTLEDNSYLLKEKILKYESKPSKPIKVKNLKKASGVKLFNKNSRRHNGKFKNKAEKTTTDICTSKSSIKNVYTNCNGFISSTSSLTSKKSEFSTTYPISTPSLQMEFCNMMQSTCLFEEKSSSSISDLKHYQNYRNIKRNRNKSKRSKRKQSKQILNDLKNVIKYKTLPTVLSKEESLPNVVILSVSSTCTLYTTPSNYINKICRKIIIDNTVVENSVVSKSSVFKNFPKDKRIISKEPFYINQGYALQDSYEKPSTDSLESRSYGTFDLSPLTAIFNFCPRSPSYFVYNTEVIISKNKRKQYKTNEEDYQSHEQSSSRYEDFGDKADLCDSTTLHDEQSQQNKKKITSFATISADNIQDEQEMITNFATSTETIFTRSSEDLSSVCAIPFSIDTLDRSNATIGNKNFTSFAITSLENSNIIFHDTNKPNTTSEISGNGKKDLTTFANTTDKCKNLTIHYISNKSTNHSTTSVINEEIATIINASPPESVTDSLCDLSESCSTIKHSQLGTESGYESSKTTKSSSFRNFFKKGGTLLEMFKKSPAKELKKTVTEDKSSISLKMIKESTSTVFHSSNESNKAPSNKTVVWFNFGKRKKDHCNPNCPFMASMPAGQEPIICKKSCHKKASQSRLKKSKGTGTHCTHFGRFVKCKCNGEHERQMNQCKKYAEKVLLESNLRKEGYLKQYNDFKEMPLDDIIGKKINSQRYYAPKSSAKEATSQAPEIAKEEYSTISVEVTDEPHSSSKAADASASTSELESKSALNLASQTLPEVVHDGDKEIKGQPLTNKEVFDKLLNTYEKSNSIAERLSQDEEFFREQVDSAKYAEKKTSMALESEQDSGKGANKLSIGSKYKSSHFSDKPYPLEKDRDSTVQADDIATCFARGFRPDHMMLSGEACFNLNKQDRLKMSPQMLKKTESIIDFSERETPLDFLLALGFMVDEASNALKDDDIRSRLLAAITEARVWINKITTTQGTLLYLVAYKARSETMRYFLQLVEAIVNKRIVNAIKLDGFLRVLEEVEDGRIQMINILGEHKFEDEENEEKVVKKQLKHLFVNVYSVAEAEAALKKGHLNSNQISLLRNLVSKYRAGLNPHLELIARYIGQGLLDTDIQLEAAMIFLSRLDTADVKLKEFENYCGISCEDKLGDVKIT